MAVTDAEAIATSRSDPESFRAVFERHYDAVWRYLRHRLGAGAADELAGDVFVRAFAARSSYRDLTGSALPWLLGIAMNVAVAGAFRLHLFTSGHEPPAPTSVRKEFTAMHLDLDPTTVVAAGTFSSPRGPITIYLARRTDATAVASAYTDGSGRVITGMAYEPDPGYGPPAHLALSSNFIGNDFPTTWQIWGLAPTAAVRIEVRAADGSVAAVPLHDGMFAYLVAGDRCAAVAAIAADGHVIDHATRRSRPAADDDKPPAVMQHAAAAQLGGQRLAAEVALVHAVAGAVVQHALLPLLRVDPIVERRVDHDQLARHPPRLLHEPLALARAQVPVEVAGEDAVELAVGKRQGDGVALHDPRVGEPGRGHLDHRRTLVEPDHVAAQMPGEKPRAAGDIEHAARRQAGDDLADPLDLLVPAGTVALGVEPASQPPVVVLAGARVVVRAHPVVDDGQ
ncbi:MAG TPA: sigma factor [Gaiellales bacterium]|nr:sigma factor [Gaiellales bacterium]